MEIVQIIIIIIVGTTKHKNFANLCLSPHYSLTAGATILGEGFVKGAEATERAIQKGGAKIRDRLVAEESPSDVSPHVTRGLNVAKQATGGAVRVSQFLGKVINKQTSFSLQYVAVSFVQLLQAV